MSGLKELKNRIGTVNSTQKMTKAMKMVSAARLRSSERRILNLRAYAFALKEVLKDLVLSQRVSHPFLEQKTEKELQRLLIVVLTSDRGLCGAFNGNICRFAEEFLKKREQSSQELFFIGKKGYEYFKFRGLKSQGLIVQLLKELSYPLSARIAKQLMEKTLAGDYDGVFVIYNEFKTIIAPRIVCERFLPFDLSSESLSSQSREELFSRDILFEVPPKKLMASLLERYFSIQIYRYLCENVAAEHGARMAAMDLASKNAEELAGNLTLKYNKLRQSSITTELTEIVSGAESLK